MMISSSNPLPNDDNLFWEAFALERCQNIETEEANTNYYSAWQGGLAAGCVSYFENCEVLTLAFRGTANLANLINDICVGLLSLKELQSEKTQEKADLREIHYGFTREYSALRKANNGFADSLNMIKAKLAEDPSYKLLITGHSLGAALATLCTADLLLNHTEITSDRISLITFGSPRTGNKSFADWIDRANLLKNIRVEVEQDACVTLPALCNENFWHRGHLTLIRLNGSEVRRVETSEKFGEADCPLRMAINEACAPLNFLRVFDSAIPGIITSSFGYLIDRILLKTNVLFGSIPFQKSCGFLPLHMEYTNTREYIEIKNSLKRKQEESDQPDEEPTKKKIKV